MKMRFIHHGKQFLFITPTLAGRPAALSQLIDAEHAPSLLPPGKSAQEILRAIHSAFPYLTLSNNVIMPDHIHLLLIANYELSRSFNPLWFSFVLIEALETSWASEAQRQPTISPAVLLKEILERSYIRATEICSWNGNDNTVAILPAKFPPQQASPLHFDRRAYIEISFDAPQLKAIRHYIRLNPARAIWKREHPDRFQCFANFRHPVLDPAHRWSGIGNLTLLASPFLFHVRLTLRKTLAEHEEAIAAIVERANRGAIPVSGFISPGERELLRRLKAEPEAHFIKILPCQLPPITIHRRKTPGYSPPIECYCFRDSTIPPHFPRGICARTQPWHTNSGKTASRQTTLPRNCASAHRPWDSGKPTLAGNKLADPPGAPKDGDCRTRTPARRQSYFKTHPSLTGRRGDHPGGT